MMSGLRSLLRKPYYEGRSEMNGDGSILVTRDVTVRSRSEAIELSEEEIIVGSKVAEIPKSHSLRSVV